MKANDSDNQKYSDAIDRIQEGYDAMVELYNDLEEDEPLIHFGQDVIENVELAKKKFGDNTVDEKINTVVREMLSWLDLDDVEQEQTDDEENKEEEK